ncbi:MAG: transposase [Planktothrix sp.]
MSYSGSVDLWGTDISRSAVSEARLSFEALIHNPLLPAFQPGDCLVLYNSSIHQFGALRQEIEAAQVQVCFLPPYSPDFNPIEQLWSKLKAFFKKTPTPTYPDLLSALAEALASISTEDILHWFSYGCYCYL